MGRDEKVNDLEQFVKLPCKNMHGFLDSLPSRVKLIPYDIFEEEPNLSVLRREEDYVIFVTDEREYLFVPTESIRNGTNRGYKLKV